MKGFALPVVLALLLAAPIVWRLGNPTPGAEQTEQAITQSMQKGTQSNQPLSITSYTLKEETDASATLSDLPRVPDTAEVMKIRFSGQDN